MLECFIGPHEGTVTYERDAEERVFQDSHALRERALKLRLQAPALGHIGDEGKGEFALPLLIDDPVALYAADMRPPSLRLSSTS